MCKHPTCSRKKLVLIKRSCVGHMVHWHQRDDARLTREVMKEWFTVKDSTVLRNSQDPQYRARHLKLTKKLRAAAQQEEEAELAAEASAPIPATPPSAEEQEREEEESNAAGTMQAAPLKASAKRAAQPRKDAEATEVGDATPLVQHVVGQMEKMNAAVLRVLQPSLEVDLPELVINWETAKWKHPLAAKERHTSPLKETTINEVTYEEAFERFMDHNLNLIAGTRDKHQRGVRRLLNLISVKAGVWKMPIKDGKKATEEKKWEAGTIVSVEGYLVALYKSQAFLTIIEWPVMDLRYGWARDTVFGLLKLCGYAIFEANRLDKPRTKRFLEQLLSEVVRPYNKKAIAEKRRGADKKQETDGLRLENLPSAEECKAAVHQATHVTTRQRTSHSKRTPMPEQIYIVNTLQLNCIPGREAVVESH